MSGILEKGLSRYLTAEQLVKLAGVRIGVAGCGGLGSNVTVMLARSGIRRFELFDMDRVEASNLNRQCFYPDDVGRPKAEALAARLHLLSPEINVQAHCLHITEAGCAGIVPLADIWVEAFDGAADKRMLVEQVLAARKPVVAASGIAGWGGPAMRTRTMGLLTVVGDFERDVSEYPPLAPRVIQAAAMMADAVLVRVLGACSPASAQA